jgi:hypothetical protein
MIFVSAYFLTAALTVANPGISSLSISNCELGEVYAFNRAQCEFAFTNSGDKPIRVVGVNSAIAGDSVKTLPLVIAPHSQSYVQVGVDSGNAAGNFHQSFEFRTDEEGHGRSVANAYGFAISAIDQMKPQIDFGVASLGGAPPEKSIELSSQEAAAFKIKEVISKPSYLDVQIGADGHTIVARIKPEIQWGLHSDFIKLAIDTPRQKQVWVEVKADVHGEIVASSNPLNMGLMRFGNHNEFKVQLTSRSGDKFKVGKMELEGLRAGTLLSPCVPNENGCQLLTLTMLDQQPAGAILGHILIDFPDYHRNMNLAVWGLIVDRDMEIHTLEPDKQIGNAGGADKSKAAAAVDLHKALNDAVKNTEALSSPGVGPLLKWTLANGSAVRGFQIFRGDAEGGPFVLLNPTTIRSTAQTEDPVNYQWRDNGAESGRTYWYYIGIVYNDGHKQQLTGPQKVIAK